MKRGFYDEPRHLYNCGFNNTKFINHATDSNITQDENYIDMYLIVTLDIPAGEELTQNYLEFESLEDLKRRGITD